mgnify:CR=1 FL=1
MFGQLGDWLGGLLGFNQAPVPEAVNIMAPEYQGAEANPGRTEFQAARNDPFARFTPEQRRMMGLVSIGDMIGSLGGGTPSGLRNLMAGYDAMAGRSGNNLPQFGQQQQQQMPQVPALMPMPNIFAHRRGLI